MCSEASQSNEFVAQLETATSYRVSGGQLTLTTSSGDMTFTPQPQRTGIAATPVN
jgi:heat shock protein HslJ